jgi:hypothetical protein
LVQRSGNIEWRVKKNEGSGQGGFLRVRHKHVPALVAISGVGEWFIVEAGRVRGLAWVREYVEVRGKRE